MTTEPLSVDFGTMRSTVLAFATSRQRTGSPASPQSVPSRVLLNLFMVVSVTRYPVWSPFERAIPPGPAPLEALREGVNTSLLWRARSASSFRRFDAVWFPKTKPSKSPCKKRAQPPGRATEPSQRPLAEL
jgi:hypothetical protein